MFGQEQGGAKGAYHRLCNCGDNAAAGLTDKQDGYTLCRKSPKAKKTLQSSSSIIQTSLRILDYVVTHVLAQLRVNTLNVKYWTIVSRGTAESFLP